jgi:hypothetical protein
MGREGRGRSEAGPPPVPTEVGKPRWDALGIELEPWHLDRKGKPILIALQSPVWLEMMGEFRRGWSRSPRKSAPTAPTRSSSATSR